MTYLGKSYIRDLRGRLRWIQGRLGGGGQISVRAFARFGFYLRPVRGIRSDACRAFSSHILMSTLSVVSVIISVRCCEGGFRGDHHFDSGTICFL